MKKVDEEILEKLKNVKEIANIDIQSNPGYEQCTVKDVIYYTQKVSFINKETNQKEELNLCLVVIEDPETKKETSIPYYIDADGQVVEYTELIKEYEETEPIKDVIDKAEEKEEQKEKEPKTKTLNELEEEKAKEDALKKDKKQKKEETKKLTSDTFGAIDLDQEIDRETLRNILGLDGDDKWIKPIGDSEIKSKYGLNIGTKEGFEIIKADGTSRYADESILIMDRQEGNNSFDNDLKTKVDGTVEYQSNIASFQSTKRPGVVLSIGYADGPTSQRVCSYTKRSGREGHDDVENNLQYKGNSQYQNSDQRNMIRRNEEGIGENDQIKDKQKEHEAAGCENDRVENIDNEEKNNLHEHFDLNENSIVPGKDITFKEWAYKLGESTEKIIDRYQKEQFENPERDLENITDEIEKDYEMVGHEHQHKF